MVTVRGAIPELGVTPRRATLIWWTAATVVVGTLLVPLFSTDIPPLLDYPNHLARMWIVNSGAADPSLSRMYAVEWGIQPNIGLDMVVPALARFMPLDLAGKVFIALAVVLPVSGAIALHRALFRHRSYWPLAAGLLGYNGMLFAGFVNFLVGAGLALWAAALWEAQRESARLPRLLAASLAAIVMFFCHIIAVGLFGVLLAGIELVRPGRLGVRLRRLLWLAIPFAVPLILFLGAPLREAVPSAHGGILVALKQLYWAIVAGPLRMKLLGVASPFLTYSWLLDAIAAALLTAALGAWIAHRRMQWAPGALIVALD